MPLLVPIIAGIAVAGGATAAYVALRKRSVRIGGIPSARAPLQIEPVAAVRDLLIPAKKVLPPRMDRDDDDFDVMEISRESGWDPVWIRSASGDTLEWGACAWDYMKARQDANVHEYGQALKMFNTVWGKAMEWIIALIKAATADVSICWRVELPAAHAVLMDGRSLWMPCRPPVDLAIEANPDLIQGWNPESSHRGFPARVGPWPLGDVAPSDSIGGAWIRYLGDRWGWGASFGQPVEVYQIVMLQDGVMKSFPAMSRRDWRIALMLGGQIGGFQSTGEIFPGGVAKWFKDWRCSGQKYKLRIPSTRKKAMNRFAK